MTEEEDSLRPYRIYHMEHQKEIFQRRIYNGSVDEFRRSSELINGRDIDQFHDL